MALRILALTSVRGVVSRADTASRTPLLPTLARESRHFANRPRTHQQQSDHSSRDLQTDAPFSNWEHLIIPDHHVQWLVRLKDGLDKKECEKIAGLIEDHINRDRALSVDDNLQERPELKVVMWYEEAQPGTESSCHLAFNYPEHVDPHVKEEFQSLEEVDLIGLSPPLRDARSGN